MSDQLPAALSFVAPLELTAAKAAVGAAPSLPTFTMAAYNGGAMRVEGWQHPVAVDLAGMVIPSQRLPVRFGHSSDRENGIGHTEQVKAADGMLLAAGVISRNTAAAQEVTAAAKNGFPWQASLGATVSREGGAVETIKAGETATVNGQTVVGPAYVVRTSRLHEISVVDLGADSTTSVSVAAKAAEVVTVAETKNTAVVAGGTTAEVIANARKEQGRLAAISALVQRVLAENPHCEYEAVSSIAAEAEEKGWSADDTELHLLRATRATAPRAYARQKEQHTGPVLEAALLLSAGITEDSLVKDRRYGEATVAAAYPLRNRGLHGIIAAALAARGVVVPHGGRALFQAAVENQHVRAAGASMASLPGILGNVANKILLDAFTTIDATYPLLAQQADFSNFHAHAIYRLAANGTFALVPPDGEIKHGSIGESEYSNRLDTYGMMLVLSRQMIVNDDLNSFRSLLSQVVRKARISLEKALYNVIMESVDSFYTTARGNLLVNPFSIEGLGVAEAALAAMVDDEGEPIYASPSVLLVPPALKPQADATYTSMVVNETTTANKSKPADNPYKGRFQPVSSPYLAVPALDGSSPTTWYLMANPNVLPAFQVAYLDGRRAPTTETADAEFNFLGMQMRCYWDFGVSAMDWRAVIKNKAA